MSKALAVKYQPVRSCMRNRMTRVTQVCFIVYLERETGREKAFSIQAKLSQ